MKKIILIGLILITSTFLKAQINAITDTGDEVLLYQDGTWSYKNDTLERKNEIPVNKKEFIKSKKSSFLVKSKKANIGIWIEPKNWSFSKGTDKDKYEYKFQRKGEDLYAIFISEKIEVPIESFRTIAIENAKKVAPDIKIIHQEYRIVNGLKVLNLQMEGTIQGVKFFFYGYYYSSPKGSVQLVTYTGMNLFNSYKDDIELFLNGLVEY